MISVRMHSYLLPYLYTVLKQIRFQNFNYTDNNAISAITAG